MTKSVRQQLLTPTFLIALVCCVAITTIWRATQSYPLPLFDLYPLYYGMQAWLSTGNAYDLSTVTPPGDHVFTVYQIGNAYPFPAILLTAPLSFLPPTVAATIWVGLLTAGLLIVLRLYHNSFWFLLYLPLIEGLRIEQYTVFIVILQILCLWAQQQKRLWMIAICCALLLTKPTHSIFFVLFILWQVKPWKQFAIATTIIWGISFLFDPFWVFKWIEATQGYANVAQQPIYWRIALCAILFLFMKDLLSAAMVLQVGLIPSPGIYAMIPLPLSVITHRRMPWLAAISFLWPLPAVLINKEMAYFLTLIIPLAVLVFFQMRKRAALGAAFLTLFLVGCSAQVAQPTPSPTSLPTPTAIPTPPSSAALASGTLVDIGGRKLFIQCLGTPGAGPTVILEAGLRADHRSWGEVPAGIAALSYVCSYDRAGLGQSEAAPTPRNGAAVVADLGALLEAAEIPGPYILVGHSFGGLFTRLFASAHLEETAGVILVDPVHEDWWDRSLEILPPPADGDSERLKSFRVFLEEEIADPTRNGEGLDIPAIAQEAREAAALGERPMIILTAGIFDVLAPGLPSAIESRLTVLFQQELPQQLTTLSTDSTQISVPDSGHNVPAQRPDIVVLAVRAVLAAIQAG